jgi:hypothetical protein
MTQFTYRLQILLEQKEEAKRAAERELTRQEQELEAEVAALHSHQRHEKELVDKHDQLRRDIMIKRAESEPLDARKVQERAEYVKVVGLQIEEAKRDVFSQAQVVAHCEIRLNEAKQHVEEARREVEVLTKHRAKQEERFLRELRAQEELALDEVGNMLYATRRGSS